ncbi:MAG TPA: hypothetical protein VMR66_04450 [Gemmatimonadota bacterium]|nr:hypothetical protein [Gemmatimonadota bacterium]
MKTRELLLGVVFAAAALACNGSSLEADGPTGTLAGQISVGPFCPVEVEGQECPPPPGTYESIRVLVYAQLGNGDRLVADTRPDGTGRFELLLPSGSYRVAIEHSIGIPGGPDPVQEAHVQAGATTSLSFDIDTGIR